MQGLWQEIYSQKAKALLIPMVNIIELALDMAKAVEELLQKVKRYFYHVMLLGYRCPQCNGSLTMVAEGLCGCDRCDYKCDPTVTLQRCPSCGGLPTLRVRRYQCKDCGQEIISRFYFDKVVFGNAYFCEKMIESRQRKQEQYERVKQMLTESRSDPLTLEAGDLNSVPGLVEALNSLTSNLEESIQKELKEQFDLNRYQAHVKGCVSSELMNLREIPSLIENQRLDLIWRFIAIIFLTHAGGIEVQQEKEEILVARIETN